MQQEFAGKIALVTGSGSGIGRGIAQALGLRGAAIVINDVDSEGAAETARSLSSLSIASAIAIEDISTPEGAENAVGTALRAFGGLDILVNNAGRQIVKTLDVMKPAEWDSLMNVNLRAAYLCFKCALPALTKSRGSVVNTGSVHAGATLPEFAAYAASKAALLALTRGMALQCGPLGVRVNTVSPGTIDTPLLQQFFDTCPDPGRTRAEFLRLHPVGRFGTPMDIGNLVAFLSSDNAGFVTGAEIVADGGMTALLFRR